MRVLIVDDEPYALDGIRRALRVVAREWTLVFANGAREALQRLSQDPFDVLVTDLHMPGIDGVGLLREAQRQWPSLLRIITSGSCDQAKALESIGVAHQFISKPYEPAALQAAVARAAHMQHLVVDPGLASFTSGLQWLPILPDSYQKITTALRDASMPLRDVGELVAQDPALSAKLLQIVNSAFFGLPRKVASPAEAAVLLGGDILRAVVLAADVFTNIEADDRITPVVRGLWEHSLATARATRAISRVLQCGRETEDAAFLAAMVHDVGSLVLLMNQPEEYLRCIEQAENSPRPLHEIEAERCGTTHAHVGGFLLSRWGLPDAIVTTVAMHHRPNDVNMPGPGSLGVLHLADILSDAGGHTACGLSEDYLAKVGVLDNLPLIRQAIDAIE